MSYEGPVLTRGRSLERSRFRIVTDGHDYVIQQLVEPLLWGRAKWHTLIVAYDCPMPQAYDTKEGAEEQIVEWIKEGTERQRRRTHDWQVAED